MFWSWRLKICPAIWVGGKSGVAWRMVPRRRRWKVMMYTKNRSEEIIKNIQGCYFGLKMVNVYLLYLNWCWIVVKYCRRMCCQHPEGVIE